MKDFLKETGKYLYDVSKILLGMAILTPLLKDGTIAYVAIAVSFGAFAVGAVLIYKGGEK